MDTWVKLVLGAGAAYLAYEYFIVPSTASSAPTSWTATGATAAQWASLSSVNQTMWNGLPASSQTGATAISLLSSPSSTQAATPSAPSPPSTWTSQGGTASQWQALSPSQQAVWNAGATPSATNTSAANSAQGGAPTSLAILAAQIQSAAANDSFLQNGAMPSGDHWNYYANAIMGKTFPAAWPSGPLTFAQYWAAESPVIAAQTGLGSIMDGLGALVRAHGGRWGMGDYVPSSMPPMSLVPADWDWN